MGLYSSLEGTNVPSSQNGLPNVSQFGWTSYEMEEYKQLIEYVDEAKQYADQVKQISDFLITLQTTIEGIKADIDNIKIDIDDRYSQIVAINNSINEWFAQISIWQQEVKDNTLLVREMLDRSQGILIEVKQLRDEVQSLKDAAGVSETNAANSAAEAFNSANKSEDMFNKCYELYESLRKGQVYRGVWNPHSNTYPDPQGTNSVWDVILNENEEEFEFDGKRWFWGDRLYYSADESVYYQIESGTNVKSVNGKTGAVTLTFRDVNALPNSGAAVLQGSLYVVGNDEVITLKGKTPDSACYLMSRTSDDAPCWFLGKAGSSHDILFKSYVHNTELALLSDKIHVNKNIFVGENQVYHEGNNPTPDAVDTYSKAIIDQKDNEVKALFDSYYNKTEMDSSLNLKADKTVVETKADKSTTINGKPLSSNIVLTSEDTNSLSKNGDTGTGRYTFEEDGAVISIKSKTSNNAAYLLGLDPQGERSWILGKTDANDNISLFSYKTGINFVLTSDRATLNKPLYINSNRVYDTSFKPLPSDIGAADITIGNELKLLTTSNSERNKEVQIFSKEGRLYAVSADGTKTQFYNDRTYRPTLADFGGLAIENGNELNFASNSTSFLFGYRQSGGQPISDYYFCNGKAQANQYSNVHANSFMTPSGAVYHPGNKPDSLATKNDRSLLPSGVDNNSMSVTLRSNTDLGLSSSYSDFLVLNTWSDSSAGNINAIAAEKGRKALYHFQAPIGSDSWGSGSKIYTDAQKPTAHEINAVQLGGDTLTGQYRFTSAFPASGNNAQIFHDCAGTIGTQSVLRSMRENSGATWVWEQIAGGNIIYTTGVNASGAHKVVLGINSGDGTFANVLKAQEIKATGANAFRLTYGSSGVILRSDGTSFHTLITDAGQSESGNWNSLRPFSIALSNGKVSMGHGLSVTGSTTISSGDLTTNGNIYLDASAGRKHVAFQYNASGSKVWMYADPNDNQLHISSPINFEGKAMWKPTSGSGSQINLRNWGTSGRWAVLEAADDSGWQWYSQRVSSGGAVQFGVNGELSAATVKINGLVVSNPDSASIRVHSPYGYVDIGPKNAGYCHIYTDRPTFAMNAGVSLASTDSTSWLDMRSNRFCYSTLGSVANSSASAIVRQEHADRHWVLGGLGNSQFGIYMINKNRTVNGTDAAAYLDNSATWQCSGNGNFNDVYIRSDRRLKINLEHLNGSLDKVCKLTAYRYDKKLSLDAEEYTEKEVGLIAQDLEEVLPEAVHTHEETTLKTISNSSVNALLVEAVKELRQEMQSEIKALRYEISTLKAEIKELKGE